MGHKQFLMAVIALSSIRLKFSLKIFTLKVWIYSWHTILFIYLLCLQPGLRAKVRTASILVVLLSQFDKSIFCAMGKCSEITAHVLRRNCWVNTRSKPNLLVWAIATRGMYERLSFSLFLFTGLGRPMLS